MFPHAALPYVASFPPAALPAFTGTTKPSDSLVIFAVLPLQLLGILLNDSSIEDVGSPRLPYNHNIRHAMLSDPGEADVPLPVTEIPVLTSTISKMSSFSISSITRLNHFSLTAYGVSVRYPTLKAGCYLTASKDSLHGGRLTFRDGIHTH